MNSEELEVSLRTEFENYLKNNLAEIKQEISQLQAQVNTELERHQSQLAEFFEVALGKFDKERELEPSFKETVTEHLRLSKDEGAQITAKAFAQAEEMEKEKSETSVGIKEIYEAVNEISSKTTQSEILKTLVHHASQFTPRGAFFIIKNEHLVGWRVFGKEKGSADEKVREVFLPLSSNSVLSQSVKTLSSVSVTDGGYEDDLPILKSLDFGHPERMLAVPLVARGRGVAVLYADYGNEGGEVNAEALETLVRVAGLTVEVLASSKTAASKKSAGKKSVSENTEEHSEYAAIPSPTTELSMPQAVIAPTYQTESFSTPVTEEVQPINQYVANDYQVADDEQIDAVKVEDTTYQIEESSPVTEEKYPAFETTSWNQEEDKATEFANADVVEETATLQEYQDTINNTYEPVQEPTVNNDFEAIQEPALSNDFEAIQEPVLNNDFANVQEFQTLETEAAPVVEETAPVETDYAYQIEEEKYPTFETNSWTAPTEEITTGFSAQEFAQNFAKEADPTEFAKDFSYQEEVIQPVQTESFATTEEFVPTKDQTYGSFEIETNQAQTAEVAQPVTTAPKSRLSERNVDLPIEVSEDERRLHNDARRFARLLVSEIKLYNEQKVKEGREGNDLYERLKEAIDRSREMYDKRVQPPVASKFDYFHYELINTLAEGDDNKLGGSYPGSNV